MKNFIIDKNTTRMKIVLTKEEVNDLKRYCDDNLATGTVEVYQLSTSGIGRVTKVMVTNLPETIEDITDINSW